MSPDEKLLAIATGDKNAAIYNLENGAPVVTAGAHAAEVLGVTYSPDSAVLATAGADWTV
jgi:WD40 repeat protein